MWGCGGIAPLSVQKVVCLGPHEATYQAMHSAAEWVADADGSLRLVSKSADGADADQAEFCRLMAVLAVESEAALEAERDVTEVVARTIAQELVNSTDPDADADARATTTT